MSSGTSEEKTAVHAYLEYRTMGESLNHVPSIVHNSNNGIIVYGDDNDLV